MAGLISIQDNGIGDETREHDKNFDDVTRAIPFELSFEASVTADVDPLEELVSISVEPNFAVSSADTVDINITDSGASISGVFLSGYLDVVYFIGKGEVTNLDDKYNFVPKFPSHVPPSRVEGLGNVPPGKQLLAVVTDTKAWYDVSFTVTVVTTDGPTSFTVGLRVNNDMDAYGKFVKEYK